MELDKRIKSIDDIQTILHYDVDCIGSKGYFFDEFVRTTDLSKCRYGELVDIITDNHDLCFKAELENKNTIFFRFFLPESDLKPVEKTYRAFTIKEFQQKYSVGSVFQIRQKQNRFTESVVQYTGYKVYEERIYLGITDFTLDELFENFEMIEPQNDTWHPFGVIDE